ncbi:hypothetical protein LNP04_00685 [Chryseobacterium sp. C-71]|uniref:hypothetical protein n=1 Tax=Chryseobacterium sp. C-71 TaxID=2893882 RepID=UPI001E40EE18|nr:hypothetical protein [Chryseobacterium sp. C-71]UFH32250.1 hypothetical protein LNP04_00685 [Chryseobacterium sp. C-71]
MKSTNNFFLKTICLTFCLGSLFFYAQITESYYKQRLNADYPYSFKAVKALAEGNNSYDYMAIGYFVNANNIMYEKTKDKYYLDCNMDILRPMFLKGLKGSAPKSRVMKVSSKNQNAWINGSESVTFEGYFYRYLGEYLFIIKKNNLYPDAQAQLLNGLQQGFNKWYNKSMTKYNDASMLFHQRLHIAANWATACLYLYEFTKDAKYKSFYTSFDQQLKDNLQVKKVGESTCYVWDSTYTNAFTSGLKSKKLGNIIQDVGHGNHIVEYVLTSYQLNRGIYAENDLKRLSNTVVYLIWNQNTSAFSDNVDGSSSIDKEVQNMGFKQTDGWMKLIPYNKKLLPIYQIYYTKNKNRTENSVWGLQYLANLY